MSKPIQTVEELGAVLHWRGKHTQAIRERDALQRELEQQKRYVEINANSAHGKHMEGLRYRDERDALRDEVGQVKGEYDRAVNKVHALQQRLTAADERADLLEGLVGEVLDAVGREPLDLDAVLRLRARMRAALKPAECAADEHVCTGCGAKGWTANCKECVPY